MKKVLLVDDEFLVRVGLRAIVDWQAHGYDIVGEAGDGKEALDLIEKTRPDIVITDIMMQPMDGISLIKACKERFGAVQFVVLSSYNDYDNVRQAMKCGAVDYIFKLTLTEEGILEVLDELVVTLPEPLDQPPKEALSPTRFFKRLLGGEAHLLSSEDVATMKAMLPPTDNGQWLFLLQVIDGFSLLVWQKRQRVLSFAVQNILEEVLDTVGGRVATLENGELLAILPVDQAVLRRCFSQYTEYLSRYLQVTVTATTTVCDLQTLQQRYGEMQACLSQSFFATEETSVLLPLQAATAVSSPPLDFTAFQNSLLCRHRQESVRILEHTFDTLFASSLQASETKAELMRLYGVFCNHADRANWAQQYLDEQGLSLYQAVMTYDRLTQIKATFLSCLTGYFDQCVAEGVSGRQEIHQLKQWMRANLQSAISVKQLAEIVNMNENYLSHLFKKEAGQSITEYLTALRVQRAKELLAGTDLQVQEVAAAIGMENTNYFSSLFKKETGQNPKEFRRTVKEN